MEIKIAVAYHKDSIVLQDEHLIPVHVGKSLATAHLPFQGDNTGDNISEKNPLYCELTALYWLWKNCEDDYIGICHYRRFFSKSFRYGVIATEEELLCKLSKFDIIVPFKRSMAVTVREQYCRNSGYNKDLNKVRDIIKTVIKATRLVVGKVTNDTGYMNDKTLYLNSIEAKITNEEEKEKKEKEEKK